MIRVQMIPLKSAIMFMLELMLDLTIVSWKALHTSVWAHLLARAQLSKALPS